MNYNYDLPDNFIYTSHLDEDLRYWRLPVYPESVNDSMSSTFQEVNALGRSAPVMTYSHSGPRTVQLSLTLRRDLVDEANMGWSNSKLGYNEDYVENLIKALQAIAVPKYNLSNKAVEPPLVAIKIGKQIFIKGVVSSAIGLSYKMPILADDKYAEVTLSLTVTEVDPYDATTVYKNGSYRGVVNTFRDGAATIGIDNV